MLSLSSVSVLELLPSLPDGLDLCTTFSIMPEGNKSYMKEFWQYHLLWRPKFVHICSPQSHCMVNSYFVSVYIDEINRNKSVQMYLVGLVSSLKYCNQSNLKAALVSPLQQNSSLLPLTFFQSGDPLLQYYEIRFGIPFLHILSELGLLSVCLAL